MEKTSSGYSPYKVLISEETNQRLALYKQYVERGEVKPGYYFQEKLKGLDIKTLSSYEFLSLLIETKKPRILAETEVYGGNGKKDWNNLELSILGDISFAADVTIFDNGVHSGEYIKPHIPPFEGGLLFVPGALLRNDKNTNITPPDAQEVIKKGKIDYESLYKLYERRLLPPLMMANQEVNKEAGAVITIPGIGCGQFAGRFNGQLEGHIQKILKDILKNHGSKLSNIKGIIFDPNQNTEDCRNQNEVINGIHLITKAGNFGRDSSQLQKPEEYGEQFQGCKLYSVVAWDHVSWPGNDFYVGSRMTDDGVKAAATNICYRITGYEGQYNYELNKYNPLKGYKNWEDLIKSKNVNLNVPEILVLEGKESFIKLFAKETEIPDCFIGEKEFHKPDELPSSKPKNPSGGKVTDEKIFTLYLTKDGRLAIQCGTKEKRNVLLEKLLFQTELPIDYQDTDALFIDPSTGPGSCGVYQAKEGELAINFKDEKEKDFFCDTIGINKEHIYASRNNQKTALYFKEELLPYDPGSKHRLEIKKEEGKCIIF